MHEFLIVNETEGAMDSTLTFWSSNHFKMVFLLLRMQLYKFDHKDLDNTYH